MKRRDGYELLRWTLLSGVLTFAVLGAQSGWSGQQGAQRRTPEAVTDGIRYTLELVPDLSKNTVRATLTTKNESGQETVIDADVQSIDRTFTGSPLSRVMKPSDYKEAVVDEGKKRLRLPSNGVARSDWTLRFHAPTPLHDVAKSVPFPCVAVSAGGKRVLLVGLPISTR